MAGRKAKTLLENQLPSLFSCEKKLVFSDGYMYGTTWGERQKKATPLHLMEKSVRGTMSHYMKETAPNDPRKLNHNVESPNPQTIDACALPMDCDTLKLEYTMKVLSGVEIPSACNIPAFEAKYSDIVKAYIGKEGFHELARRYAINIANGRSLWRNRLGAEKIEVIVQEIANKEAKKTWTFNAYDFSLRNFDKADNVTGLANVIAEALSRKRDYLLLRVQIYVLLGEGQEVYPSQEMFLENRRDNKSKVLYQTNGVAAMHSQKLGNAIRTIDTWYPKDGYPHEEDLGPIAIEPYGQVTNREWAFRQRDTKKDFYTLLEQYCQDGKLDNDADVHYVMAVLVRGGVFSFGKKDNKGSSKE